MNPSKREIIVQVKSKGSLSFVCKVCKPSKPITRDFLLRRHSHLKEHPEKFNSQLHIENQEAMMKIKKEQKRKLNEQLVGSPAYYPIDKECESCGMTFDDDKNYKKHMKTGCGTNCVNQCGCDTCQLNREKKKKKKGKKKKT